MHAMEAAKAGVPAEIIGDIAARRTPRFDQEAERIVYEFSAALVHSHAVPDDIYRAAVETLGEQATVELVGVLGYYTLVAMTLNAFDDRSAADGNRAARAVMSRRPRENAPQRPRSTVRSRINLFRG